MNITDNSGKLLCDHHYADEKFDISRATLYRLAGKGLVKAIKSGRRTLWSVESIVSYLNSQPEAQIGKSSSSSPVANIVSAHNQVLEVV